MIHRYLKILPWYVNRTLAPAKARKVAAHLDGGCPICLREIDALSRLIVAQGGAPAQRPVSQARLDAVLVRIDRYELQQRQQARTQRASLPGQLNRWFEGWLPVRPAIAAAACAALVLGIVSVTMLRSPAQQSAYRVLSSEPTAQALRIKLRFQSAPTLDDVERVVRSGLARHRLANAFRIEARGNGEYLVIFEDRPSIGALAGLLDDWRGSPNVVDVAIDAE